MASARILVSSLISSASAAHGGPVASRRQAAALSRRGFDVRVAAPAGEALAGDPFGVEIYPTGVEARDHFGPKRYDATAVEALGALIERFRPAVLYDVHGPPWAVDAASRAGVPVVSMMGDYTWYCIQTFLVDSRLQRCSGPETPGKCFACANRWYRFRRRALHAVLKPAAQTGFATFPLWDRLNESADYLARMRSRIGTFVVGDAKAFAFLVEHGVAAGKIVRIPQGLPSGALRSRRALGDDGDPASRKLRLCFVGRADPEKGLRVLARAFDSLPREIPVELWIVHADEARAEYIRRLFPSARRFAGDLGAGRIRLFRPRGQDEVFELMARADVGVVPSLAFESPSLAMLEFVAQGTPIVRSESEGMQHVIQDGVNGRTFPYGDWRALARIILEIAAQPAVVNRWREALPRISGDDDYARALEGVFARAVPAREATTKMEMSLA